MQKSMAKIQSTESVIVRQHKAKRCPNHPDRAGFIGGLCGACYNNKIVEQADKSSKSKQAEPKQIVVRDKPSPIPAGACSNGHPYTEETAAYRKSYNGRWRIKCLICEENRKKQCINGHIREEGNFYEYEQTNSRSGSVYPVLVCRICKREAGKRKTMKNRNRGY